MDTAGVKHTDTANIYEERTKFKALYIAGLTEEENNFGTDFSFNQLKVTIAPDLAQDFLIDY